MRLSELAEGTPIRLEAYRDDEKKTEIWGKMQKNSKKQCQIDIYYYEGLFCDSSLFLFRYILKRLE